MNNLQTAENSNMSSTWNGALSYATVNNPLVEIFFKSVRDIPCTDYRAVEVKTKNTRSTISTSGVPLEHYFDKAWESDPLRTLKLVFYLRDCRGGKGERKLFRALIRHMRTRGLSEHVELNMKHIPTFGTWKDIGTCFFGTDLEPLAVKLIAEQLKLDLVSETPSLCAKYAPSESGAVDKAHKVASKVAAELGVTMTRYRKKYLAPLRAKLNIVEREMCSKQWSDINYEKVTSIAGNKYKKAFKRQDGGRYSEYLSSVVKGEKKMNTGVLMPHQIISPFIKRKGDETGEAQWKSFVDDRRKKWNADINIVPLVDVSGSMMYGNGQVSPIEVAISLGMLFAELNTSDRYHNKFITFHSKPELLSIKGDTLADKVKMMVDSEWGGSTNFERAFDLLLDTAKMFGVPQKDMPEVLLVLSDMQFDQACSSNSYYCGDEPVSNWNKINSKYEEAGYRRPTIIFWNLNGTSVDFPVPDAKVTDCALIGGYSDEILYSLLDGKIPDPLEVVHKCLDAERYGAINLA